MATSERRVNSDIAILRATVVVEAEKARRGLESFKSGFESVKQSLSRVKQSFLDAQATIDHFGNNVTRVAQAVQWGFDKLNDGARKIEIKEAFEAQLGGSEQAVEQWLSTLEDASSGTVSEFNLISSASKAMSLGVTDDLGEMESLLEISRFKARKFGTDVSTAFEDISIGVGRQSKLILDNLGIVVDTDNAYAAYAESIGKVASQLTDAEKKQAFLNAVLQEGQREIAAAGGLIDSEADKLRQLQVEWDKAVAAAEKYAALTVGRQIAPREEGGTNQIEALFQQASTYDLVAAATARARQELTGWNEGNASALLLINQTVGSYDALRNVLDQNGQAQAAFTAYVLENYVAFGLTEQAALSLITGLTENELAFQRLETQIARTGGWMGQFGVEVENVRAAQMFQTQQTDKATMAVGDFGVIAALTRGQTQALATQAAILAGELYGVANAANTANYALGSTFGRSDLEAMRNKAGSPLFELSGGKGTGLRGGIQNVFSVQSEAFQASQVAIARAGRAGLSEAEKQAREIERIWNDLISEVRGGLGNVLNFNTTVGQHDALLDSFGLRNQLESTETARRLADVRDRALEGQRSPWLAMFPEADAADTQEIAARAEALLRDLSAGRRFDLLDRDTVKADLKEYIAQQRAAEAWKDSLVQEVAAEMGTGATEIDKAVSDMLGLASENAGDVSGGVIVAGMSESMRTEATARMAEFEQIGESLGKGIGTGTIRGFGAEAVLTNIINQLANELGNS